MQLENEFTVAAPVERAWAILQDLEQVAPCMPGAALTSFDGEEFAGTVRVKLGPVVMSYAGKGRFVERDDGAYRAIITASGQDSRGGGAATARIATQLDPDGDTTRVRVVTELNISGRAAQFGRGMIADVSARLIGQFADCLSTRLAAAPSAATAGESEHPRPPSPSTVQELPPGASPVAAAVARSAGAEPVDLLAVSGVTGAVRRAAPYAVCFLVGVVVGGLLVAWLG